MNRKWENRVEQMIDTDKTVLSEALLSVGSVTKSNSITQEGQPDALVDAAIGGYLSGTGDRFAMYMNESQYKEYLTLVNTEQGMSYGIGISALYDSTVDGIYVVNVYEASPAQKSGIVPGNIITHVNNKSVKQCGFYSAMLEITAGTSTNVKLRLGNGENAKEITVAKDILSPANITGRMYDEKVGVIRINEFTDSSYDEFVNVLGELVTASAEAIIIDVRNNPGGNLEAVARILDFICPEGVVISGITKSGNPVTVRSDINEFSLPMAVIVNKNTVCGAEMFAGALSDTQKAKIFGENTYGKATTQEIFSVVTKGVVSISTTKYNLPSGKSFENSGISPDYNVLQTFSEYPVPDDADIVLQTAAQNLNEQIQAQGE